MISIPKTFKLGGRDWEVNHVDAFDDEDMLGQCIEHDAEILLLKGMKPSTEQAVFYHELTHAFWSTLGWEDDNKNEGAVDAQGSLLLQFLLTRKGSL